MTKVDKAESGRCVVVRWRLLAERRLSHLIELYESGRWKMYHDEAEFLAMVQEARAALKTWEMLAPPDAVRDKPAEVAVAKSEERIVLASPFVGVSSANGVVAKNNLSKS
ncbi:MAG TPA: TIGR03809 family protein [Afipia sp.]